MNLLDSLIEEELLLPATFNGQEQRREVWICIRTDGARGNGSKENPYNASTAELFDELMGTVGVNEKIRENMTIRLGPGTFRTKGGSGASFPGAWRPQNGQRIIGSGMFSTTLQLVDAGTVASGVGHNIVGNNSAVNNFEISDLTLDCNFARQLNPSGGSDAYNSVMIAGVNVNGRNNRVRRVRVINFGTGPVDECFPIFLPSGNAAENRGNPIIEDCIVELPNDGNGRETTCLSAAGDPSNTTQGAGAVIRNCYVNCELANPQYPEHRVVAVRVAAPFVYLTTQWPHCLNTRDIIYLTGSLVTGLERVILDGGTHSVEDYRKWSTRTTRRRRGRRCRGRRSA